MDNDLLKQWTSIWPLTVLLLIVTVFVYTLLNDIINVYVKGMPPGPPSLPIIGGLYKLSPSQPHIALEKLIKTYGKVFTVQFGFLGPAVFICDPDLPYKILSNKIKDRPPFPVFKYLNGEEEGIGSVQYSPHLKQLRMMSHQAMNSITKSSIYQHTNKAFKLFFNNVSLHQNHSFDPSEDITKMTLALLTSYIYGFEYETFDDPLLVKLRHNRDVTISVLFPAHPFNIIPWTINIPSKWSRQLISSIKDRNEVLQAQYTRLDHGETVNPLPDTVLGKMAALRRQLEDSNKPGIEAIKISCWTLDTAGASTLLNAVQWLVVYLALHREVQQRALYDINKQIPSQQMPTLADRANLPYLEAIIMEVLRIAPPVPMSIPRTSLDHGVDMGKYHLAKGTIVLCDIWHIHHNETYWPDPDTFKPERFLDPHTGKCIPSHTLSYFLPFGHGKRSCVGEKFANNALFLFTCALVKCMDIKALEPQNLDLRGKVSLGLEPFPHTLKMKAREGVEFDQLFKCDC